MTLKDMVHGSTGEPPPRDVQPFRLTLQRTLMRTLLSLSCDFMSEGEVEV